ncbi:MAG TPA: futalosine hydrolase, partial [Catenuloplanes sp.]
MSRDLLVVTAVDAEADAVRAGLGGRNGVTVAAGGGGPAAAAAGPARRRALAEGTARPYRAVLSAGIGGGIPGRAALGAIVLGTRSIAADLGAQTADGFISLDVLGFGDTVLAADPTLLAALRRALPEAVVG